MNLILVKLAVLVLQLSFLLERYDDETDEDVDHEKGDDDDVDEVENSDGWAVVGLGTAILGVRVDASMHQSSPDETNIVSHVNVRQTEVNSILLSKIVPKLRYDTMRYDRECITYA